MAVTAATLISEVRLRVDEPNPRVWTDANLLVWLNEGNRDVARRTETLEKEAQFPATATVAKYALPTDTLRVFRVEFQPQTTSTQPLVYPVQLATKYEMDQYWGSMQFQQRAYPSFVEFWGNPPNITMQAFPVPSQSGNWNVFYYGLPAPMVAVTDPAQVVEGWYDALADWCEYKAMRMDRDDRWQDAKKQYEETVANLIDVSRRHHDQAQFMTRGSSTYGANPMSAYGGDGWF